MAEALLLVDLQNDFMPDGALPVPGAYDVIPATNALQTCFPLVLATQDWHPANHGSFAANHPGKHPGDIVDLAGIRQVLWPVHCVQETPGAAFARDLDTSRFAQVFRKGTEPLIDSYSAFFDNAHRRSTGLADYLREKGVDALFIAGVATDYCVKFTALDARRLGLRTIVVVDACRGVELAQGDIDRAVAAMRRAGALVMDTPAVLGTHRHAAAAAFFEARFEPPC